MPNILAQGTFEFRETREKVNWGLFKNVLRQKGKVIS